MKRAFDKIAEGLNGILSGDYVIHGQWTPPLPRSEIEAMLAEPVPPLADDEMEAE